MADAELKRILSFQYPAAHLGHLSDAQQEALDSFKELCQKEGYYTPVGAGDKKRPSHDDETLLRYLRARKFVPKDAFVQFKDTEDWRKENSLEQLYDGIDVVEYEETRRLYPQWTGRRDKRGIPIYLFEVAHLNSKTVSAYTNSTSKSIPVSSKVPAKMLRLFALYENLTRFVMPLCSAVTDRPHPETPISQSNNIVDISRVGLKMFWNLKNHMQDASQLATAHYPETLDRIFIIGAPTFFPTVWGWIKRWFDPVTVSKIFILSSANVKSTLEEYIDIANIPKKYGGELDFEFGMMPVLEPAIEAALKWENPSTQNSLNTIPSGPIRWDETSTGELKATAVGSENGNPRKVAVATLLNGRHVLKTMYGQQAVNVPIPESAMRFNSYGNSTHPVDTGDDVEEPPPDSESSTPPSDDANPGPETQTQTQAQIPSSSAPSATGVPKLEGLTLNPPNIEQSNTTTAAAAAAAAAAGAGTTVSGEVKK